MRIFFTVILVLVLIGSVVGLGSYIYNAGVTQGLAASGKLALPDGAAGVAPYVYSVPYRPWGPGFGLFGLIFPLLFIFLVFSVIRGLFFRGWRGRGPWGHDPWNQGEWEKNVPPMVQQWHRKMHETEPTAR